VSDQKEEICQDWLAARYYGDRHAVIAVAVITALRRLHRSQQHFRSYRRSAV